MNYLKLPNMDNPVSFFDICQAHQQLEADYNMGGWLRERPSNVRRNESTSCQLHRMKYHDAYRHVEIYEAYGGEPGDDDVRDIYILNVLKWNLPTTAKERTFIARRYTKDFLKTFPHWRQR